MELLQVFRGSINRTLAIRHDATSPLTLQPLPFKGLTKFRFQRFEVLQQLIEEMKIFFAVARINIDLDSHTPPCGETMPVNKSIIP